jgi:hypothetical protein
MPDAADTAPGTPNQSGVPDHGATEPRHATRRRHLIWSARKPKELPTSFPDAEGGSLCDPTHLI